MGDVLSNPQKREIYDTYGNIGIEQMGEDGEDQVIREDLIKIGIVMLSDLGIKEEEKARKLLKKKGFTQAEILLCFKRMEENENKEEEDDLEEALEPREDMIVRGVNFWKHDKVKKAPPNIIKLFLKEQGLTKFELEQVELEVLGIPYTEEEEKEMEQEGWFEGSNGEFKHNTGSSGLSYGFSPDGDDGSGGKPKTKEDEEWEDSFFSDEEEDVSTDEEFSEDNKESGNSTKTNRTKASTGAQGNSDGNNTFVDRRRIYRMPVREMQVEQGARFWLLPKVLEQSKQFPGMVEKFLVQKGLTKWEIDEVRRRVYREVRKEEEEKAAEGDFFETEDGESDGNAGLDDEGYDMNAAAESASGMPDDAAADQQTGNENDAGEETGAIREDMVDYALQFFEQQGSQQIHDEQLVMFLKQKGLTPAEISAVQRRIEGEGSADDPANDDFFIDADATEEELEEQARKEMEAKSAKSMPVRDDMCTQAVAFVRELYKKGAQGADQEKPLLFLEKQGLNEAEMAEVRKRLEMTEEEEVEYMKTRHAKDNPITDEEIEAALKSDVAEFYKKYNPSKLETPRKLVWILRKYAGPEKRAKLMIKLRNKYGLPPLKASDTVKDTEPKADSKQSSSKNGNTALKGNTNSDTDVRDDFFTSLHDTEVKPLPTEEPWKETGNVKLLYTKDFTEFRSANARSAVFFYAPWCPPCMKTKRSIVHLSKNSDVVKNNIAFGAIDCEHQAEACNRLNISTLPSLLWFDGPKLLDGKKAFEDLGDKNNALSILEWIMAFVDPLWGPDEDMELLSGETEEEQPKQEDWSSASAIPEKKETSTDNDANEDVKHNPMEQHNTNVIDIQKSDDLIKIHKEKPSIFAMFYAPWCDHCKESKPIFEESASKHKDTTKYVRIDCEAQPNLCYEYQIDGYPTFYYFASNLDEVLSYGGPRTLDDFDTFITAQISERVDDPIQTVDLKTLRLGQVKGLLQELGIVCNGCKSKDDYVSYLQNIKDMRMKQADLDAKAGEEETDGKEEKGARGPERKLFSSRGNMGSNNAKQSSGFEGVVPH